MQKDSKFKLIPEIFMSTSVDYNKFINYNKLLINKLYSAIDEDQGIDILYMLRPVNSELKIFDLTNDGLKIDSSIKSLMTENNEISLLIVGELYNSAFGLICKEVKVKYLGLTFNTKVSIRLMVLEPFKIVLPSGGTDVIKEGEIILVSNIGEYTSLTVDNNSYERNLAGSKSKLYIDIHTISGKDMVCEFKKRNIEHFSVLKDYDSSTPWFITSHNKQSLLGLGIDVNSIDRISDRTDELYFVRINNTDWNFTDGVIDINIISGTPSNCKIDTKSLFDKLNNSEVSNITYEIFTK